MFAGQNDLAIEQFRKTLQIEPTFWVAHNRFGDLYLNRGMYKEALDEYQQSSALLLEETTMISALTGDKQKFQEGIQKMLEKRNQGSNSEAAQLAYCYAAFGDKDSAFQWFNTAIDERTIDWSMLAQNRVLNQLKSDPRFNDLKRRLNLQ